MNARIIVLGLTVCLALLVVIPRIGLASETEKGTNKRSRDKDLYYDHKMVEKAPAKSTKALPALPYTVMSWRPYL